MINHQCVNHNRPYNRIGIEMIEIHGKQCLWWQNQIDEYDALMDYWNLMLPLVDLLHWFYTNSDGNYIFTSFLFDYYFFILPRHQVVFLSFTLFAIFPSLLFPFPNSSRSCLYCSISFIYIHLNENVSFCFLR
jgi:hypothetical protein